MFELCKELARDLTHDRQ